MAYLSFSQKILNIVCVQFHSLGFRNRLGQIISVPLNLYKQQTSPFLNSINLRPARDARLPRLTSNDYLLSARTIQLVSTLQDADADKHN